MQKRTACAVLFGHEKTGRKRQEMKRKLIALALSAAIVTTMPALDPGSNDIAYAADSDAVPISATAADAAVVTETPSTAENAQDPQPETAPTVITIAGKTSTDSKSGKVTLKAQLKEADLEAALRAAADAAEGQEADALQPLHFYIHASAEAKADKTVITISKTLLKKIRKQTKAPLEIGTYLGSVTLDRKLMNSLISKAKGTTVAVVTEKSELSAEQKRLFGKTAIARKISFRSGGKTILNPNSIGASAVLDLYGVPDALRTGEIGIGRVITGGKVYQNKFSSEKTEKNGSSLLRCKIQGSLQGTFVIGEKAQIETAWIISGVRNTTIQAKVSSTEKAQPGRVSRIRLNWTKSKGFQVDGYEIYHSFDDSYYQKAYTLEGNDCYNRNVTSGTTKYYKIRGYRNVNGQICYTRWSNVISASV